MKVCAKKLGIILANGQELYAAATGLKQGTRGKVMPIGKAFGYMTRGAARKVRKALRRAGRTNLSGAPRGV